MHFREFCVHSPQIWPHIKKEVGLGGGCIPRWVVFTTLYDMPIFQVVIETVIMVIKFYLVLLFYLYLPGRTLTAQT